MYFHFGMCTDIVEIWFGIANGQVSSIYVRVICLPHDSGSVLSFHIFIIFFIMCKYVLNMEKKVGDS